VRGTLTLSRRDMKYWIKTEFDGSLDPLIGLNTTSFYLIPGGDNPTPLKTFGVCTAAGKPIPQVGAAIKVLWDAFPAAKLGGGEDPEDVAVRICALEPAIIALGACASNNCNAAGTRR